MNFHHGRHGNARCATPKGSTKFRFALFDRKLSAILLELFISGVAPQTPCQNAEGIYKIIKSIAESMWLIYPKATFATLSVSGELQTSRLPRLPWFKNPASKSHFSNHNKTPHLSNFLSLFSNGDSPQAINLSHTVAKKATTTIMYESDRQKSPTGRIELNTAEGQNQERLINYAIRTIECRNWNLHI